MAPQGYPLGKCQSDQPHTISISSSYGERWYTDTYCQYTEVNESATPCKTDVRKTKDFSYTWTSIPQSGDTDGLGGFESGGEIIEVVILDAQEKNLLSLIYSKRNNEADLSAEFESLINNITLK